MFRFNAEKYDFWPVYAAIQKYHPIGVPKEEVYEPFYTTSPHWALRNEAFDRKGRLDVEQNEWLPNPDWQKFVAALQHNLTNEIEDITHPQAPCFTAYVEVERAEVSDVIRIKDLLVFISILGPFYTVIGQNITALKTVPVSDRPVTYAKSWCHRPEGFYPVVHHLAISPIAEFEEPFQIVCRQVEEIFSGYRFIPFSFCKKTIAGLEVPQTDDKPASVFQALFSGYHHLLYHEAPLLGDERFKEEVWIKEGYEEKTSGGWTAYPPNWSEERRNEEIQKLNQSR